MLLVVSSLNINKFWVNFNFVIEECFGEVISFDLDIVEFCKCKFWKYFVLILGGNFEFFDVNDVSLFFVKLW